MNIYQQCRARKQERQAEELAALEMQTLCRRLNRNHVQSRIDARIAALPPMVAERRAMMVRRIISSEQVNDMGILSE